MNSLSSWDLSQIYEATNSNTAYEIFIKNLDCIAQHFPLKTAKTKERQAQKPWISQRLVRYIRKKNRLFSNHFAVKREQIILTLITIKHTTIRNGHLARLLIARLTI